MNPFEGMSQLDHEQVVYCRNDDVGLKAIIGIHSTVLGPSLGGCRLYPYANEQEALRDVLRLSRGMTYKAAVAGLDLGGGRRSSSATRPSNQRVCFVHLDALWIH